MTSVQSTQSTPIQSIPTQSTRPRIVGSIRNLTKQAQMPISLPIVPTIPAISTLSAMMPTIAEISDAPNAHNTPNTSNNSEAVEAFSSYLHDKIMGIFESENVDDVRSKVDQLINESKVDLEKMLATNTTKKIVTESSKKTRNTCQGMCFPKNDGDEPKPCKSTILKSNGYCINHDPDKVALRTSGSSPKSKATLSPIDVFCKSIEKPDKCQCTKKDGSQCNIASGFLKPRFIELNDNTYYVFTCGAHKDFAKEHIVDSQIVPKDIQLNL